MIEKGGCSNVVACISSLCMYHMLFSPWQQWQEAFGRAGWCCHAEVALEGLVADSENLWSCWLPSLAVRNTSFHQLLKFGTWSYLRLVLREKLMICACFSKSERGKCVFSTFTFRPSIWMSVFLARVDSKAATPGMTFDIVNMNMWNYRTNEWVVSIVSDWCGDCV